MLIIKKGMLMGNLLEKITLYDLLGYTFPGCVLLLLLFLSFPTTVSSFLTEWEEYLGIIYFIFFLTSYFSGIILSELTEMFAWIGRNVTTVKPAWEKDASLGEQIAKALKSSGYPESREQICETIKNQGLGRYMGYMYGSIQVNAEYQRIHDYASAYVMYKNLGAAFIIGTVFLCRSLGWNFVVLAAGGFLSLLLINRSIRFYQKKNQYAVIWFLDKFAKEQ